MSTHLQSSCNDMMLPSDLPNLLGFNLLGDGLRDALDPRLRL
ncbi:MAG: hypothetical protein R6V13_13220 [Anaerolineae bacterium]